MFEEPTIRKTLVPPEGPKDCLMAFIGQSPGAMEERKGQPFIGPAGTLLDKCCHLANVPRRDVYITNLIKERPIGNDITQFIHFTRSGPQITNAYQEYEDQLHAELNEINTNVFITFGQEATWALTRQREITKYRGSILQATLQSGREIKVIPIIHPAAALRQYIYQHFIVHDLRKALKQAKFPEIKRKERTMLIRLTHAEIMSRLKNILNNHTEIAYDIEVSNGEITCESFAINPLEAFCIPYNEGYVESWTLDEETQIAELIGKILANKNIKKIGQNISFDGGFRLRKYGQPLHNVEDTMVGFGILHPDFPKGLDFLTSIYTDEPYYKDEGKIWNKITYDVEDFWQYNNKDTTYTYECFNGIVNDLEIQGNLETYKWQRDLIEPILYMQERGFCVDLEGLEKAKVSSLENIERLEDEFNSITGGGINPASPKQLAEYFYRTKGLPAYKKRGTGRETTDETALKRLSRKGIKEAAILLELRHESKLNSTYYNVSLDNDNRLRCAYNAIGTKNGRLSSSKTIFDTGMNMQNQPDIMKQYLIPDSGYMLYNIDLSSAENRIVANIAPDTRMKQAFDDGLDVHSLTGSLITGIPYDEIRQQNEEDIKSPVAGGTHTWRFWGKKANHGFNYDLGYKTFGVYNELPDKDAKFIHQRYHAAYPGVRHFHAWVRKQLSKDRTLTNLYGRKRLFLDRWGDALFKEAYAMIPQSTCVDKINREGMIYVYYNQDMFGPLELLAQVHDSIVFQIPISIGWTRHAEMLLAIKEQLETPIIWHSREFIIPADVECGLNYGKRNKTNLLGLKGLNTNGSTTEGLARQLDDIHLKLRAA